MPVFVHICHASDVKRILRAGLKVQKHRRGVYAMPVTPDYYASHQWIRELRRWRSGELSAIYLRIPGAKPVLYGHYHGPHAEGDADEATAALMNGDTKLGFEVIILGDVPARAVIRVGRVRPITGWRYSPNAKGREPCGCPVCQTRGEPFSQRFRKRFEAGL